MNDDLGHDPSDEEERSEQVRSALLKALVVVIGIGVAIALGTTVVVRALGLNESESPGPVGSVPSGPPKPLPTTALPVPGEESESPTKEPSETPSDEASPDGRRGRLELNVSPLRARPMERVNLTGTYKGADNVGLQVQRFEDGAWRDFGVDATVRVGTYETYVMTGRSGENRFRMYDPAADQGSNVVMVTIG
jgi:hypothetical protein